MRIGELPFNPDTLVTNTASAGVPIEGPDDNTTLRPETADPRTERSVCEKISKEGVLQVREGFPGPRDDWTSTSSEVRHGIHI